MKKNNNKGFTMAELLIVVAIIAVLVAIAIPVFGAQLEKAKIATDEANVRSWYAEQVAGYLSEEITTEPTTYDGVALKATGASATPSGEFAENTFVVTYSADKLDADVVIGGK